MVVSIKIIVLFSLPNHTDFILHAKFRSAIKRFFLSFLLYTVEFHYKTVSLFSLFVLFFYSVVFVCLVFICRNQFHYLLSFSSFDFIHTSKQWEIEKRKGARREKVKRVASKHTHTHTCTKSGLAIDRIALNHCQCQ